ncbi:MAG: hypothetical protein JOZ39_07755 [Chloroflexi bacterium]|nr:hypothetical protein [Chloroflexota bacterium]
MAETYDSVLDRMSAFNVVTERLSKGRAATVGVTIAGRPECWLRLTRTADSYRVELPAEGSDRAAAEELKFKQAGESLVREIRKGERSWTVAGELEDMLHDVLGLPADVAISVETEESG